MLTRVFFHIHRQSIICLLLVSYRDYWRLATMIAKARQRAVDEALLLILLHAVPTRLSGPFSGEVWVL